MRAATTTRKPAGLLARSPRITMLGMSSEVRDSGAPVPVVEAMADAQGSEALAIEPAEVLAPAPAGEAKGGRRAMVAAATAAAALSKGKGLLLLLKGLPFAKLLLTSA